MTPAEKQQLVQEVVRRGDAGRTALRESGERLLQEIEGKLLEQGIPADLILYMRERREMRRAVSDIARKAFPVETLPDGALPIFERDLGVAAIVTDDPEAGS